MADLRAVQSLERLLHNILREVTAVKQTVQTHDGRFDDIMFHLNLLQKSRDEAPLKTLPRCALAGFARPRGERVQRANSWEHERIMKFCFMCSLSCDLEMAGCSSDEETGAEKGAGLATGMGVLEIVTTGIVRCSLVLVNHR